MTARRRRPTTSLACLSVLLCRLSGGANATPPPAALALPLIASCLPVAMAVDRSKFRTCDQTSFCRRHRHGRSRRLYDYSVVPGSVEAVGFGPSSPGDGAEGRESDPRRAGGGILSKFGRKLGIGGGAGTNVPTYPEDTFRGPGPVLTARIRNVAPLTSSALTKRVYGKCDGDGSEHGEEELNLDVHLHADGVARVRITEVLGEGGPRSEQRWTSDELVLNADEMSSADAGDVTYSATNGEVLGSLGGAGTGGESAAGLITSLVRRAGLGGRPTDGFLVLSHGDWRLMVRLSPLSVYYFRDGGDGDGGPPMVVAGTGGLTHFEVRRDRGCPAAASGERRQLGEFDVEVDGDSSGDEEPEEYTGEEAEIDEGEAEDRHGGKEIVGYWEDGLAIYADGTREERRDLAAEAGGDDAAEGGSERRRLEEDGFDTAGMWDERFGDHHDTKPRGPMSVGMELTFPGSSHLFGLPEHASSTQLMATGGADGRDHHYKEPYRLYNLDVFEYELDETMALYGHIPLVVSQSMKTGTVGAFWFNPTETFVDVEEDPAVAGGADASSRTHFISESGVIDLFLLPGPGPAEMYGQYARITGRTALPPMFSLGYHQCRWNYRDETDVFQVHAKFEELDYPYDVLWLDIEHTDGKRYFTWDRKTFPNPIEMQQKLGGDGRRMVTIIDPHIKRDDRYYIHQEATALGLYIKDRHGKKDYDGWCWPGSSSYLDFTDERVRIWWARQFNYDKYQGSTPDLFTWNDMNEPSVFNGPEVSMQKDLLNLAGCEHREWHNLYGMLFHRSTGEGLVRRNDDGNVRPFVLSRSFFAGSQRYGAIWTGDNESKWSHLAIAAPMLLGLNVAALSFVGADVGGFFGNPDAELMTRWMQAGAYQPFFRGHAHHDSKRREPWMFGDETMVRLRRAAMARYALLPQWYTLFWEAGVTGMPVMRTMWMQYPKTQSLFSVDDQYLIGSDLLVKPVVGPGVTSTVVQFPAADCWYDVDTMQRMAGVPSEPNSSVAVTVASDIDKIPVYQRGGSIVTRKLRLRRSSHLMAMDPYTLYVALGDDGKAAGDLYMDDEVTFAHERERDYVVASFSSSWGDGVAVQNSVRVGNADGEVLEHAGDRVVERIVVMGVERTPGGLSLFRRTSSSGSPLEFQYDSLTKVLVVRKPEVTACEDFHIQIV